MAVDSRTHNLRVNLYTFTRKSVRTSRSLKCRIFVFYVRKTAASGCQYATDQTALDYNEAMASADFDVHIRFYLTV